MELDSISILIRGAGEMASGVAVRLSQARFPVVMTERPEPMCVRRTVSFCEAIHAGQMEVEGVQARRIDRPDQVAAVWAERRIALLIDPHLECLDILKPHVLIDATLAKRNLGLSRDLAPLVIGLGPGFNADADCHVVVETNRGHNLGKLIYQGPAEPDTGIPGEIGGETVRRVLRAPTSGVFLSSRDIGDIVQSGDQVAEVEGRPILTEISGVLRGLIRPGTRVSKGLKVGDIDPRGRVDYCFTVSDKARSLGGAVLEAILHRFHTG